MVALGGGAVSYERGTPVGDAYLVGRSDDRPFNARHCLPRESGLVNLRESGLVNLTRRPLSA